jgi:hypothetical protein
MSKVSPLDKNPMAPGTARAFTLLQSERSHAGGFITKVNKTAEKKCKFGPIVEQVMKAFTNMATASDYQISDHLVFSVMTEQCNSDMYIKKRHGLGGNLVPVLVLLV